MSWDIMCRMEFNKIVFYLFYLNEPEPHGNDGIMKGKVKESVLADGEHENHVEDDGEGGDGRVA